MLNIKHRGIQANLDLNTSTFTGKATTDNQLAYLASLKAGKLAGVDANGKVALASSTVKPIGFIVVDASANPVDNYPAVASHKLAVTVGNCVVVTDQIKSGDTLTAGQPVYACETAGSEGLVASTGGEDAQPIGIALNSTSATVTTVEIAVL